MAHWTVVLSNVSLAEFVLLAALTAWQWMRHHIRGAGWVALSFVVVGGLSLALQIDPSLVDNQNTAKSFVAVLLLVPYFLFRFAASFRRPSRSVGVLALALTAAMIGFTFWLADVPSAEPPPRHTSWPTRSPFSRASPFCSDTSWHGSWCLPAASPRSPPGGCAWSPSP